MTATAIDPHAPTELLSAYLDSELPEDDGRRLEEHLALCPSCRAELTSLHRVVDSLRRLERTAPPPALAQHVQRRIALDPPRTALGRFEDELTRLRPMISIFMPLAVVIALAAILYLFASTLHRLENRGPAIVIPSREAASAFREPGTEAAVRREAGGRTFERTGNGWRQLDLPAAATPREVAAGTPEAAALLAAHPWLADLLADGAAATFLHENEALRLVGLETPEKSATGP